MGKVRKSLKNAMWLIVAMICFVTVFGLVMAFDSGTFGGNADVAFGAETAKGQNISAGDAQPVKGTITPGDVSNFMAAAYNTTTSSWTVTDNTLKNTTPSDSNFQAYKDDGDTSLFTVDGETTAGHFKCGTRDATVNHNVYMVINYQLPDWLAALNESDGYTIKVNMTSKAYLHEVSTQTIWWNKGKVTWAMSSRSAPYTASSYATDNGTVEKNSKAELSGSNKISNYTMNVSDITLTKKNKYVSICYGMWCRGLNPGNTQTRYMIVQDITLNFTISYSNTTRTSSSVIKDGAAPIMTRSFVTDSAAESYSPLVTDVKNLPVCYDSIASGLSNALDAVEYGVGGQLLKSYKSTKISSKNYYKTGSSTTTSGDYYKTAQLQFSDAYDFSCPDLNNVNIEQVKSDSAYKKYAGVGGYWYGSTWSPYPTTNTTYAGYNINTMCSGIKSVTVGDSTVFNMYGASGTSSSSAYGQGLYKAIYVGNASTPVGCAEVIKDTQNKVTVVLYMFDNANVKIKVEDYGGKSNTYATNFKGIDKQDPTNNVTTTDTDIMAISTKSSVHNMLWIRDTQLKFSMSGTTVGETSDANYSPYIWFYTVKKAETKADFDKTTGGMSTASSATAMFDNGNYQNLRPIGFRTLQNFEYNFVTGMAKEYGSNAYGVGNPGCLSSDSYAQNPKGSGYYMFSFYVMDAAGNFSTTVKNFFVRVDFENPQYDVNLSYVKDSDGTKVNITAAENGKKWSTGETTLEIIFNKANISGNTLAFGDNNDSMFYITFDRALASQRFISFNDEIMSSNSKGVYIYTTISNTDITILYEDVGDYGAKFTITFAGAVDGIYPNVAWITTFTSYVGTYKSEGDIEKETSKVISWVNNSWIGGVQVLIDRNRPDAPVLSDENELLVEGANNYNINIENKHWYTENYTLPAKVSFEDSLSGNETYGAGIKVFYGIKFVTDAEGLGALATLQDDKLVDVIGSMYTQITEANGNTYFDRFVGKSVKTLDGAYSDFPLDLIEARKGGMRVVYSWVVDQAGNYSDINIYYVLADAQTYTISSNVRVSNLLENGSATIAQKNEEGENATAFKRGEKVTFELGIRDNSDDGGTKYVPFRFARVDKQGSGASIIDLLLENYSPQSTWVKLPDFANLISFESYDTLEYTIDSNTTLGALDTTLYFQLAHRKVITYKVTETQVTYTAQPAVVKMSYSDENAASHFLFRFVDKNDNILYIRNGGDVSNGNGDVTTNIDEAQMNGTTPVYFVPIVPDSYRVRIYIPKTDEYFVTSDYTSTNGEQTFVSCTIDFRIRNGEAKVIAKTSNTLYGDKIDNTVLGYTIEGYAGEVTRGSLKLNIPNWDPNALIPVGPYQIVEDEPFYINDFYTVTFESAVHRIAPRGITISTWADSKAYGDNDKQFKFGVSSAQFDWYTVRGGDFTVERIIAEVFANFGNYTVESVDEVNYYLFTVGKTFIGRVSGEDVGTYEYNVNTAMFDLGENFTVSVQTMQVFTIVQRTVVLNVGSQSTVLLSDTTPVYGEIIPSYMLDPVDAHLAAEIEVMLSGKLSIDTETLTIITPIPDGYTGWEWHTILLAGDAGNDNIRFELGDDTVYIIYFADAILIKLKSGVTFSAMFGTLWTDSLVTFSADKFELTSKQEIPAYDSISWTVALRGVDANTYPSVGSYAVIISDIKLIKDGEEIEDCFVIADNFNFTITAAPVVVRPTASINGSFISTKTYGEPESVFNIGFEIVSVGGRPVEDYLEAGYTREQIYNQISGEFVRGWFASTGDFREFGTRNSAATDANGFVVGTDGDYYAFYVGSAFTSGDRNFTVIDEIDKTVRFHILPKEITLDAANFVGVSKSYDGSTNVNYNRVTAYSIADQLAFTSDDLKLAFEAQYSEIGSIEKETPVRIIFTNLRLEGRSVGNYVLTLIMNTSITSYLYIGEDQVSYADVSDAVRVEIECIYNNLPSGSPLEEILIYMGTIALYKSDFTVTKAYDNSRVLGNNSISIAERSDDQNRGTSTLYQVWKRGEMQILEGSGAYNGTSVSNNYVIGTLLLFFPIQGATGLRVVNGDAYLDPDGEYNDPDVKVTATDKGIRVELTNIRASITKRELNVSSFVTIAAVDRAYNSEAGVSTTYEFSSTALAPGDTAESVGLTLRARINDTNFDQGTHRIAFMPVGNTSDDTILKSANYSINIDALNSEYYADKAKTVNISRAKLIPNGVFQNKEYDGTTDVEFTHSSGENDLTTLQYAEQLMHELVTFTISGNVTYNLSANGKLNENVTESGWHNVLVSGLKIEETAGNNYLRNYEIYGSRYVGESYRAVGAVTSGTTINDYEILDAMQLTKRKIQILVNNINIKEKVYDGTRDAVITVSLEGSHIVEGHDKFLEIQASGTFAKSIVNTNVAVTIGNIRLVAKEGGEAYINNYLLEEYTERRAADIVARPVSVTASLGTKTYDGLAKIPNNLISINISGLFENEAAGYAAQASGGAYFVNKNVLLDENNNVSGEKPGAVFNPELKNNRGKSNYAPAYATTVKDGDDYIAYVLDGVLHYKELYDGNSNEVVYYYALPTVDKYILFSDNTFADEAFEAGAIVGCYTYNKQEVYAVKSTYKGNVSGNLSAPVTYITGKGMIKQKNIYVSANGIEIINDSVLTKMYDRTDKFYGTEKVDYRYNNEKGIVGLIKGDDVTLSEIQGKFDSADTTANYVIFTASGIDGKDKDNYIVDMTATSARRQGSITKRTIKSVLEDGTMVYGDVVGDIVGSIKYKILGNQLVNVNGEFVNKEYDLELWNGGLFMQLELFAEMMGLKVEDYKDIINVRYLKDGDDNFYEISSSDANWNKAYLMLSSVNSLPTAKAVFNMSKPAAGTTASSYTLVGGNAINYSFKPVYTSGNTSKMTVVRKNLFIATNGEEYTLVYGENVPSVNLLYLDMNGNYGIASSETLNSVFGEYSPIVKFGVFNVNTKEFKTQISKYPTITLSDDEMYVVYVDGLKDKDGNQLTVEEIERVIPNYTLNFGKAFAVVKDKVVMTYEGFEFTATASELFVRLPEVTGVELGNANGNEYHATYNGTNLASSALVGDVRAYDEIGIVGEDGISYATVNAGVYEGYVMIVRSVAIDENDPNGYFVTWVSPQTVTFVVDKASPNLTVEGRSKYFDNEKYEYTVSGGKLIGYNTKAPGLSIVDEYVDITYFKQTNGAEFEAVDEMRNAGTYRVKVQLNKAFEENNPNYAVETVYATYTILKLVVNVTLSTNGFVPSQTETGLLLLGAVFEKGKTYNIEYTVSMAGSVSNSISIVKAQTSIVFASDITSSGRYPFSVEIVDSKIDKSNYNLVGANGILELTTSHIGTTNATVDLDSVVVANKLVANEVYNSSATASDMDLWLKVEQYMPSISQQASLAAMVRLELYYGSSVVGLNGANATIEVEIPKEIGNMEDIAIYMVTADGGLQRLTDYTVTSDGKIRYTTNYLGDLMFVNLRSQMLPLWAIILIAVAGGSMLLTLAVAGVCLIIRKRNLRRLV